MPRWRARARRRPRLRPDAVASLWDTTLVSRIQPRTEVLDYVVDQAVAGDPVRVAAAGVLEVVYGYQLRAASDARFRSLLDWFTRFIASDALNVVPLDGRAAVVAGQLRGESRFAPPKRSTDRRSKTMRQAAWLMDIEIAAIAFAAGLDVATANRSDFEALAAQLATLYPDAPPLAVLDPPL
jgi:predicted nucleic acid-binding protein